jgi:hypothetical protein
MGKTSYTVALAVVATAACSGGRAKPTPPPPDAGPEVVPVVSELAASKTTADLSRPDPDAAYWRSVPKGAIALTAQPMINPRPERTTTEQLVVQAVHDGTTIAFRLEWSDPDRSEAGKLGAFSDALAIEFPVKPGGNTPVMMGAPELPVHIYHWRAQYQRDKEKGKPTMADLYPNASVDMYPMDFKEAASGTPEQKESFSPGLVAGNPQSYEKTGVDEIIAEGFATSQVQEGNGGAAHAVWNGGRWSLVITRPLVVEGGSTLSVGGDGAIAFAAWKGGLQEVGSRKSVTMAWVPLRVQ